MVYKVTVNKNIGSKHFHYQVLIKGSVRNELVKSEEVLSINEIKETTATFQEIRVPNKTIGINLKIPMRTVVYSEDHGDYISISQARIWYNIEYIRKYKKQVEDTARIPFTHEKALKALREKLLELGCDVSYLVLDKTGPFVDSSEEL